MRLATATRVSVSSLDSIKMEERKRPALDENHTSAPPSKKQAVIVNGANTKFDAEMPWKDDINVRFF